jgi:uncharacterized protein YkwD
MEDMLLEWVNRERTAHNMNPLRFLPGLRALAVEHSKDMASHQKLTHLSSSGKLYSDRLVDAGLYFIEIGENVATSETFDVAFIHQGFMSSPEHRDNILNPNFDTAGIGIVHSQDQKYFITQDFFRSLKSLETDEAEISIQDEINNIRKRNALPPLFFHKMANNFARRHSQKKACGQPLLNIADFLGETHIHFITTPVLVIPKNISREIATEMYETGAVGAWFGRVEDYPGGTYLITLFLFPKSRYKGMTEKDFVKITLEAMNSERKEMRLVPLKLDRKQSKNASDISRQLKVQQANSFISPERPMRRQVISYVTENLRVWPDNLDPIIIDPSLRRVGIGISHKETKETQKQTFWITLIF